ncbi:MAG TPA: NAD(P)H-binding protein, partial [Steroidobacteraceae bacterium]|nr:NAD(P)H-binding protein [Steroidobacteraceae bacterium]
MWLVTHASGTIGRAVVAAAKGRGQRLRLMVRDPSQVPAEFSREDVVVGSFTDPVSLANAMNGVEGVVLVAPLAPETPDWHSAVAAAAHAANVSKVLQVSALGADPKSRLRLLRWHGEAETRVAAAGIKPIVLRPALCMQVLLKQAVQISCRGQIEAPARGGRWPLVDARDVADVALHVMEHGSKDRVLELTGPEALDYFAIAQQCSDALQRHITYVDVCSPRARGTLEARRLSPRLIEALLEYWDYAAAGALPMEVTDTIPRLLGRPARTLGDFLHDALPEFRQASGQ